MHSHISSISSHRSRWQRARLGCSIVVIVAFFFIIPVHVLSFYTASMATPNDVFDLLVEEQKEQEPHTTSTAISSSSTSSFSSSGFSICPTAMHLITDNKETVQSLFKELYTFHNMGGNLMTLDKYLNKQINPTLKNWELPSILALPQQRRRQLTLQVLILILQSIKN